MSDVVSFAVILAVAGFFFVLGARQLAGRHRILLPLVTALALLAAVLRFLVDFETIEDSTLLRRTVAALGLTAFVSACVGFFGCLYCQEESCNK